MWSNCRLVIIGIKKNISYLVRMIPQKVKDHIEEYISQEVYVQIAIIKAKKKFQQKQPLISILRQTILEIFRGQTLFSLH